MIIKLVTRIYWVLYRLFPAGRNAWKFKKGYEGLLYSNHLKRAAKMNVVHSAYKQLKEQKILAFLKGKAITKAKKSNYQVLQAAKKKHKEELEERGLKITASGKFRNK